MASCPGCRKEIREGWKFCRFCGHALTAQDSEPETSLREHIATDVLARQIGPGEMGGILNKTVVVEEGQSALLFVGGRHDLTLGPGKHSMGNILSSRTRDVTVVLVRTSDVSLHASVSRLLSSDPLSLSLDFRLVLKIEEPMRFWRNLANGADSYHTKQPLSRCHVRAGGGRLRGVCRLPHCPRVGRLRRGWPGVGIGPGIPSGATPVPMGAAPSILPGRQHPL